MKNILTVVLVLVLSGSVFAEPCTHNYKKIADMADELGFTVTSTTGGRHNPNSKHYMGKAIDVSVKGKSDLVVDLFMQIMADLGYVVLDERVRPAGQKVWTGPHIHVHSPMCEIKEEIPYVFNPL